MTFQIGIILAIMVIAYVLAKWKRLSVELCMGAAALAGGLAGAVIIFMKSSRLDRYSQ